MRERRARRLAPAHSARVVPGVRSGAVEAGSADGAGADALRDEPAETVAPPKRRRISASGCRWALPPGKPARRGWRDNGVRVRRIWLTARRRVAAPRLRRGHLAAPNWADAADLSGRSSSSSRASPCVFASPDGKATAVNCDGARDSLSLLRSE